MNNYRSLNHTKWECQYHVVFIPKYRRKTLYGGLRHYLGDVLRRLAEHSGRVGWRKGICWRITSTCWPTRLRTVHPRGRVRSTSLEFPGFEGVYDSTVGQDERVVREYVQQQEREDRRLEQLRLEE